MLSRHHLSPLVVLSIALWVVGLLLTGTAVTLSPDMLRPIGPVLLVVGALLTAFDRWLWRFKLLYPWFVDRPNLQGTWRTTIVSSFASPGSNAPLAPIDALLVIRQTYSSLHIQMMTAESSSSTIGATITRAADGSYTILGTYQNRPREEVSDRSRMHVGAMWLSCAERFPSEVAGFYWTDRGTRGDLTLADREQALRTRFTSIHRS